MVQIGSLSWKVQVEKASEAKKQAEEVGEQVENAKDAMEQADEQSEGLSDKLGGLEEAQELAGKGFDKMNAKAGFFGTALSFVTGTIMTVLGALLSLKALLVGGLLAALVGLAIAWKQNIGDIRDRVSGFVDFLGEKFAAAKATVLKIWNNLTQGFTNSSGDIEDLKTIFTGVLDGLESGLKTFWDAVSPIWSAFVGAITWAAKPVGRVVGEIVSVLATLEEKFGFVSKAVAIVTSLVAAFATAYAIVQVVTTIIAVVGTMLSVLGTIISIASSVAFVFMEVYSVIAIVIKIAVALVGALNPVTLAIMAIIGIAVALYAAWKTNFFGIRDIVNDVVSKVKTKINNWVQTVQNAIGNMKQEFRDFINNASNYGSNFISNVTDGIKNTASELTDAVKNAVDTVRDYLPFSPAKIGPLQDLDEVGPGFINTIVSGIRKNAGKVKDEIENMVGDAAEYLPWSPAEKGPLSNLEKSGPGLVNTVASGIEDETPKLAQAAEGAAKSVDKGLSNKSVQTGEMAKRGGKANRKEQSPEMKKVEINVGGIDIGDQSLDLSNMSRMDLRRLAQEIAGELGDEVRSVVS